VHHLKVQLVLRYGRLCEVYHYPLYPQIVINRINLLNVTENKFPLNLYALFGSLLVLHKMFYMWNRGCGVYQCLRLTAQEVLPLI
jgi:hypothetical protein